MFTDLVIKTHLYDGRFLQTLSPHRSLSITTISFALEQNFNLLPNTNEPVASCLQHPNHTQSL